MTTPHRRAAIVLAVANAILIASAIPCLAQVPPLPCSAPGGGLTVRGRIMDPPGGGLDGVACCDVQVMGPAGDSHLIRTRADGTFATCFECGSPDPTLVSATPQCGSGYAEQLVPECFDPANGLGVTVDLGDITCTSLDPRYRTAVQGTVVCRSGALLEPVADCGILVETDPLGEAVLTRTDANGDYEACVYCVEIFGSVEITAQCCGERAGPRPLPPCTERLQIPTIVCDPCPVAPCVDPEHVEVRGQLVCADLDADGLPDPVPGCGIVLTTSSQCGGVGSSITLTTDPSGRYSACMECPASESCAQWLLTMEPECCPGEISLPLLGCEPVIDLGSHACTSRGCPAGACPPDSGSVVRGRITCHGQPTPGALLDVVGCGSFARTTTDANGEYSVCIGCVGCGQVSLQVFSCFLGFASAPISCGEETVLDLDCCPPPPPCAPGQLEVHGNVSCLDAGGMSEAIAGCDVVITCTGHIGVDWHATTDLDGDYSTCVFCLGCETVLASARCCNSSVVVQAAPGCPPMRADISCGACGPPPDPCNPEQTIAGRVTCDLNGDGVQDPLAGCPVRVECVGVPGFDTIVTTDASGGYVACIPCTTCTLARATALCCGQSTSVTLSPPNCVPARADIRCINCPPPSPCGPSEQAILGRVTCLDAGGQRQPLSGCDVSVDCVGGQAVVVTTDANGDYVACLPCGACTSAVVTALCCGSPITVQLNPANCLPVRQDVDCGACVPPRPCPGPPSTLVNGALACQQGNDHVPLANCAVILQALDAGGSVLLGAATAVTDGAGRYSACLPCVNGMASIRATAQCCNVSVVMPVAGCPDTLSLGVMLCTSCSPCPAGSTRLQGQIHCRGGGPVANCAIRVVVTTCDETLVFDAQADVNGKYRLCIPCPCNDTDVRVTALCCNASRAIHVDRCGPITPVPTLYCPSPCR